MRTGETPTGRPDPLRSWTLERERFHRARALRLLLPGLVPLATALLVAAGVVQLPSNAVEWAAWLVTLVLYAAFWVYLIRDARRFVEAAAEVDRAYRTHLEGHDEATGHAGATEGIDEDEFAGPVLAVAGRRIDARTVTEERFPLGNVGDVRERLGEYITSVKPSALVCSAACGADLLALDAAESSGIRRRVVLPFDRNRFRQTSVTDRPGRWGPLYDRVLDSLSDGDLLVLSHDGGDEAAYAAVNEVILEEASRIAGGEVTAGARAMPNVVAVIVWDGRTRGPGDLTEAFRGGAERRGFPIVEISTL